jgi:hypothetical protein
LNIFNLIVTYGTVLLSTLPPKLVLNKALLGYQRNHWAAAVLEGLVQDSKDSDRRQGEGLNLSLNSSLRHATLELLDDVALRCDCHADKVSLLSLLFAFFWIFHDVSYSY